MTDTSSAASVTIDVQETLRFFDEKPDWSIKQATTMVGVFGEDLSAACFRCYIESQGACATVRSEPVTTGKGKGPWLDRWIVVDWPDGSKTVFQTEIKNWSAHAFDGKTLPIRASAKDVAEYKQKRWELKWDSELHTLTRHDIAKVLIPMKLPSDLEGHAKEPLLIFWEPVGPRDKADEHLFRMDSPSYRFPFKLPSTWPQPPYDEFRTLWVFSVSSYLRSILDTSTSIELEMPDAYNRLQILGRLLPEFRSHR